MDTKEEYLVLREEVLHLDTIVNNTINFFYVFMATYLAFSLTQDDTVFLLLSYVVIIPAYMIVLSRVDVMARVGGYLKYYHEGKAFKWETRNFEFRKYRIVKMNYIISSSFPFLLGSIFVLVIHVYRFFVLKELKRPEEIVKLVVQIALFISVCIMMYRYRNISTEYYINKWEEYDKNKNYHSKNDT